MPASKSIHVRLRRAAAVVASLGLLGAGAILVPTATAAALTPDVQPPGPTRARVATLNVLGYGHTMPGGDRRGYADGVTRQKMVDQLIRADHLDIIGFQEMESPQISQFKTEMGASYDIWPGRVSKAEGYHPNVDGNSIAWRRDRWTAVETSFYRAPYFRGTMYDRPVVLLESTVTGQRVYVTNTHNAANTFGDAQAYRDRAVDIQAALVNRLRASHPGVPVIFTGDMNDSRGFFCRITKRTTLRAANGGTNDGRRCVLPPAPQIDWVLGTPDATFSGYRQLRTPAIKKATDHPLVFADLTVRPVAAQRAGIGRVVVLDVEGLPAGALTGRFARYAPQLRRLLGSSSATLHARTDLETTRSLPNLMSLVSGRPAARSYGGHGVTWFQDKPRDPAKVAARGVASLFDVVHDNGGSTSFLSSDANAALVRRTYSARYAAPDRQGVDYGRAKLSVSSIRATDRDAAKALKDQLRQHPRTVSVVQLGDLRRAGQRYGFLSPAYLQALKRADAKVGSIWTTLYKDPDLARSTLLVVTSDSGGARRSSGGQSLNNYQVPFIVWGHGVPARTDLYALNPDYHDPGGARLGYGGPQPIRVSDVANLVTGLLGYQAVPGSRTRTGQDFNVFAMP